jgi:MSHA pilin protein MshA
MRNQKGFTLIELIIVIVVLGILAVTAAPQFINFSGDARASALKGMEGSVKGAMQLTYSKAAIEGVESDEDATVDVKGTTVELAYGYPVATVTTTGNGNIIDVLDGSFADGALTSDWVYIVDATSVSIAQSSTFSEAPTTTALLQASNCYIVYNEATDENTPATVSVTDTDC